MAVPGNPYAHLVSTLQLEGKSYTYYNLKSLGKSFLKKLVIYALEFVHMERKLDSP